MAFQSLYRKYRPQRFGELVGQEHVTSALRNAVREGRVGHAYLFSGPRGTGKTTTARILAKALNCTDLTADGEPDGVCENCVAIAEGRFNDLVELDAGAAQCVGSLRPILLIETIKSDKNAIAAWLDNLGYTAMDIGINFFAIHTGDKCLPHIKMANPAAA